MEFIKITEQESNHKDLEKKSVVDLVNAMHEEDNNALKAVHKVLPKITELINEIKGLRSIYLGPIELSYLAEMSTPLLLNAMIRNKIKNPGIKII